MKRTLLSLLLLCASVAVFAAAPYEKPWTHGRLQVSENHLYLQHADGTPFFWQGETGWLMPEKLNRAQVGFYLTQCANAGYNVVQVQTVNGVPAYNVYGQPSMIPNKKGDMFDFTPFDTKAQRTLQNAYTYWDHFDYIFDQAEQRGIYIGMVCIWGGLVKAGLMDVQQAKAYGKFLAERYGNRPNVVWIIGGDQRGDVKPEVWEALANTIRQYDKNHLVTYHPFGRTSSVTWWNDAEWLDFNMFQSGHRRYGQRRGDGDTSNTAETEEDNWRYVEAAHQLQPLKPILDAEPSYERIPQGLHDTTQPQWQAQDCRRYAWWSVLAGSCGHTYGNNALMQFYQPGDGQAYGCTTPWYEAVYDPGFLQMQYVKRLMLMLPYFDRVADQSVLVGEYGKRYERPVASRGKDYIVAYTYVGGALDVDLSRISGSQKKAWWYSPSTGEFRFIGQFADSKCQHFAPDAPYGQGYDQVLVIVDASKDYIRTL